MPCATLAVVCQITDIFENDFICNSAMDSLKRLEIFGPFKMVLFYFCMKHEFDIFYVL